MQTLDRLSQKLNPIQKLIVGIVVPLILIVIYVTIAENTGTSYVGYDALVWDDNWYMYIILISIIGYFEYKLFQSQE